MSSFWQHLREWQSYDTWIVLTGAVVAMSCAVPGLWLLLRRQSMMGDALSHTALPAVVGAFLVVVAAQAHGFVPAGSFDLVLSSGLFLSAILVGVLTTFLTEWLQRIGRVESSAALGVVFTSLFALGLILVRRYADRVHIDPDCFLFGALELTVLDTVRMGPLEVPKAILINGTVLLLNGILLWVTFKEVRLSAFDPDMANTIGINSRFVHYALMAVTALAVVAAFETVGSILVVGLLIVPPAAALLLSRRFSSVMFLSLGIGAAASLSGHVLARAVVPAVFEMLGYREVLAAGTSGMIATAAGLIFTIAVGVRWAEGVDHRLRLVVRIAAEDQLGTLYRIEEPGPGGTESSKAGRTWLQRFALWRLRSRGSVERRNGEFVLTPRGREAAVRLVRAHRLFESYMQRHFQIPDDHLHATAHNVEHFLDEELQGVLEEELDRPERDPHGRAIPPDPKRDPVAGTLPPPAPPA